MTRMSKPLDMNYRGQERNNQTAPEAPYMSIGSIAISVALGILVISCAYTAGRHGYSESRIASDAYLVGEGLILIPTALRLLSRRGTSEVSAVAVAFLLAVSQYIAKVLYSPLSLTFSDELSHWRTVENILVTGKLFTTNYTLPISAQYPGLEEATAAFVQITGIPLFPAALIVAGLAHVLLVMTLYLLFRNVAGTPRLAGLAILIYSTAPGLGYFDSIFGYQTLALALLALVMLAAWHLTTSVDLTEYRNWTVVAVIFTTATVITHHVTSFILICAFLLVAAAGILTRNRRVAMRAGVLAATAVIMLSAWIFFKAPDTVGYLSPTITGVLRGFISIFSVGGHSTTGSATPTKALLQAPYTAAIVSLGSALLLSALVALGWWLARRGFRRNTWVTALILGSISWYAVLVIRVLAPDGSELSGRAATFVFIFAAYPAALALQWLIDFIPRFRGVIILATALVSVVMLGLDGTVNSWPPFWERLPGPHQVGGVERAVGPEEIAAGEWMARYLGPGNRVSADIGFDPVLGSYADQTPLLAVGFLYMSPSYTSAIQQNVDYQQVHYAMTDMRLTTTLPVQGAYWGYDPDSGTYTHPLPVVYLTKFENIPGVSRIFDDGNIAIYDLRGDH